MYWLCKEAIICDGILHVNMLHYLKTPILYVQFFALFIYIKYIRSYSLLHVVSKIFASAPPPQA